MAESGTQTDQLLSKKERRKILMNSTVRHLKMRLVSCIFVTVLTTLLLTAQVAQAAALTCGAWSLVKSPNAGGIVPSLYGVAAVSKSDVWAVGDYLTGGYQSLIDHWNGTSWSVVASPKAGGGGILLVGASAASAGRLVGVGC